MQDLNFEINLQNTVTAGDDLTLNANVTAAGGTGSITLNSANDIFQTSGAISAASSGAVDFNASTDSSDGVITQTDGTTASSGTGPRHARRGGRHLHRRTGDRRRSPHQLVCGSHHR